MATSDPIGRVAIVVMAKAPIAGVAKTRLGRDIGYAAAAALYQGFLLDTLDLLDLALADPTTMPSPRFLICPDDHHANLLRALVDPSWTPLVQQRSGLMGGIVDAFDAGFGAGAGIVLVTDADSPTLPPENVRRCHHLATTHDLVLGPTPDGGYYLIGARRAVATSLPDLLLTPSYVSATICTATLQRAAQLGLTTATGPVSFDVDTVDELAELRRQLLHYPPERLRHTRHALARDDRQRDLPPPTDDQS